jgi:hypothetical protein
MTQRRNVTRGEAKMMELKDYVIGAVSLCSLGLSLWNALNAHRKAQHDVELSYAVKKAELLGLINSTEQAIIGRRQKLRELLAVPPLRGLPGVTELQSALETRWEHLTKTFASARQSVFDEEAKGKTYAQLRNLIDKQISGVRTIQVLPIPSVPEQLEKDWQPIIEDAERRGFDWRAMINANIREFIANLPPTAAR